jgi:hypothetical protein
VRTFQQGQPDAIAFTITAFEALFSTDAVFIHELLLDCSLFLEEFYASLSLQLKLQPILIKSIKSPLRPFQHQHIQH